MVYDESIIPALVKVLFSLLTLPGGSMGGDTTQIVAPPVAYIATTVRNEDTRDKFLIALGNNRL